MVHYIIDGYNLLFRHTRARESEDLKTERQKVIQELSKKLKVAGLQASLIFDAHLREGLGQQFYVEELSVYFTDEGETADDYIVELVRKAAKPLDQIVVTSDAHLAWRIRRKGARSLSVEEFKKTLERIYQKKISSRAKREVPSRLKPLAKRLSLEEHYEKIFEENLTQDVPKPSLKKKTPKEVKPESDYERWLKAFEETPP